MLKNILLSVLCVTPALVTAQISLDLDMTINRPNSQDHRTRTIIINENMPISAVLDDYLVCNFIAQSDNDTVIFEGQLFETTKDDTLIPATNVLKVTIPFNQQETITIRNVDNYYELIVAITPTAL